jgi:predicted ABC-type ATPase
MKMPQANHKLYMIGGPNGAGKTTAAMNIMPELIDCYEYVNADAIAAALSPFRPNEVTIDAGRLMLSRIRELAEKKQDFAFETTMASRSFVPFLNKCKNAGYRIHLVYIWLHSPDLSIARVAQRVESGGHFVPDDIVRMRYDRGLKNFFKLYMPIADTWAFYDNSYAEIQLVAQKSSNESVNIVSLEIWKTISELST